MAEELDSDALVSYRPAVRALIAHVLGTAIGDADVEDCASEVFRRALEGKQRLQPGAPLRPWLLGIARHVALDARRVRSRARRRAAPSWPSQPDDPLPDNHTGEHPTDRLATDQPDPYERTELAERTARVRAALALLAEPQRQALLLHAEGLGYRDIADKLAIPLGTVCTWIARGRQVLTRAVNDDIALPAAQRNQPGGELSPTSEEAHERRSSPA